MGLATWVAGEHTVFNLEVKGFHTYFVGDVGAWVHNGCGADLVREVNDLPSNARINMDEEAMFERLESDMGIDRYTASERLHAIKAANQLGPADNVYFDMTGTVFHPDSGEALGLLTQMQ